MRSTTQHLFLFLLILIGGSTLGAHAARANPGSLEEQIKAVTLDNGMRFLLLRRAGAPIFTAYIRVKVGGVDEADGKSGIAHLLEHMAFKGTSSIGTSDAAKERELLAQIEAVQKKLQAAAPAEKSALQNEMQNLVKQAGELVNKEEFTRIYNRNGANNLNATTSQDLTSYFVTLPNTKLRLWAFLESSRLLDPVFREFYSERDVVREERRSRVDDSPFGKLYEALMEITFAGSPYARPTIGYPKDLETLSATDLKEFYDRYYSPGNMVVAIVGNIELAETESIIREYFGKLPKKPPPPEVVVQKSERPPAPPRHVTMAASPAMMVSYPKPTMPHRDDYIFDVLQQVLCEGNTSRLYQRLVEKDRLVQKVGCSASTPGARLDNAFFVYATLMPGTSAEKVSAVLNEEFQGLVGGGVTDAELQRAKKNLIADWYYEMQSNDELAELLSYFEVIFGDWRYIFKHREQIQSITSQDLKRVTGQYLTPAQSRTVILDSIGKKS